MVGPGRAGFAGPHTMMGILERIAGRSGGLSVHVAEESAAREGARGDRVVSIGDVPVSAMGEALPEGEHGTSDPRAVHFQVAGTHYMPSALQDDRFGVGSRITVRLAEAGGDDAHAVGVWDSSGTLQVGYAPPALARPLSAELRRGEQLSGVVVREMRLGSASGERLAVFVIVGPGRIELVRHASAAQ